MLRVVLDWFDQEREMHLARLSGKRGDGQFHRRGTGVAQSVAQTVGDVSSVSYVATGRPRSCQCTSRCRAGEQVWSDMQQVHVSEPQ